MISELENLISNKIILKYYNLNKNRIESSIPIDYNNLRSENYYVFKKNNFDEYIIYIKKITQFYIVIINLCLKNNLSNTFNVILDPSTINIGSNIINQIINQNTKTFLLIGNKNNILYENINRQIMPKISSVKYTEEIKDNYDYTESITCKICFCNKVNVVYVPCGHLYCSECDTKKQKNECPICRTKINSIQAIFI